MIVFGIDWLIDWLINWLTDWLSDSLVQHIKLTVAILKEEQQFVSFLFLSLSLCYDIYQICVKMRGSTQRSLALENSRRFAAPRRVSRRDFGCLFFWVHPFAYSRILIAFFAIIARHVDSGRGRHFTSPPDSHFGKYFRFLYLVPWFQSTLRILEETQIIQVQVLNTRQTRLHSIISHAF